MRVGPSRLTSTAASRGESKETVAAEWMTMSAGGERGPTLVVEAQAVGADVARHRGDPPVDRGLELVAPGLAEAVEGVVAEDLPVGPPGRVRTATGPDEQDELAARRGAQEALDQRRAEEAGAAGDGDALAVEAFGDAHDRVFYHLVSDHLHP